MSGFRGEFATVTHRCHMTETLMNYMRYSHFKDMSEKNVVYFLENVLQSTLCTIKLTTKHGAVDQ